MKAFLKLCLLLAGLLPVCACDGVTDTVSDVVSDPGGGDTAVPVDTATPVLKEYSTADTTLLPGDTTRRVVTSYWKGTALVSRDTQVVAVTDFVWLVNRYGEDVVMEAWTGDSLEWRNGYVLGNALVPLPDADARSKAMADGGMRRLSARSRAELLVVAGIPGTEGVVFLASRRYLAVTPGDTLYLDRSGVLLRTR